MVSVFEVIFTVLAASVIMLCVVVHSQRTTITSLEEDVYHLERRLNHYALIYEGERFKPEARGETR